MKANTITLIIFIGTIILCSNTNLKSLKNTVEGEFQRTAKNLKLSGSILSGSLQRANGTYNKLARLDLNNYVSNSNGNLVWGGRDFMRSCLACRFSNNVLSCSCRNSAGRNFPTELNLVLRVTNSNGNFTVDN